MSKVTPPLADKLRELPREEEVEVVVEFGEETIDALDRADNVEQMRAVFAGYTAPLKAKIQSLGGDITGEGWLNGTLQCKMSKSAVESLDDEPAIARVDLPRALERE